MSISQAAPASNATLWLTVFARNDQKIGQRFETTYQQFCEWVEKEPAADYKGALRLIKLGIFRDDVRSNEAFETIYGIELDYDAGLISPQNVVEMLKVWNIEAFITTTPSHRSDAPRFRLFVPLSMPHPSEAREGFARQLDTALGTIFAPESFVQSQAYYVGSLTSGEPLQCWRVAGRYLDTAPGLPPIPPRRTIGSRKPLGAPELAASSLDSVRAALALIDPNDLTFGDWIKVLAASMQSAWTCSDPDGVREMLMEWCARFDADDPADDAKQMRAIERSGTELGWKYLSSLCPQLSLLPIVQVPLPGSVAAQFWTTFNADDTAKTSAVVCLKTIIELGLPVAFDEFSNNVNIMAKVPWHRGSKSYPLKWTDSDTLGCRAYLETTFIKPSKDTVYDCVAYVADGVRYHPVRDYLNGLSWDGVPRLSELANGYFGSTNTTFAPIALRKFMVALVARVFKPGCKVDTMIILEGPQGARKSSALRILASDEWFTDQLPDISGKDASIQLNGKLIVEIAELDRMNRAEATAVKAFTSRQIDTYRPPFGRSTVDIARQCVFAGSTNEDTYLRDQTGNRRFWPITCGSIDTDAIARDRDQLWAEAVAAYQAAEAWWLDAATEALARDEQDGRREADIWEGILRTRLAGHDLPVTPEYICSMLGITFERQNAQINKRIASVLKTIGYHRHQIRAEGGMRLWHYVKK